MNQKIPCENSLSAMPGDFIKYNNAEGVECFSIVRSSGWQPAPKGGKVWTYETSLGDKVPNTNVMSITKYREPILAEAMQNRPGQISNEQAESCVNNLSARDFMGMTGEENIPPEIYLRQELMSIAESLNLQSTYKVVLSCILEGDADNIQVAADLLKIRARQLKELADCEIGIGQSHAPTTNPLKEDTK